jgi:predicted RNA binding protein YcfA (HicA-like mRNA interferase family)
MNLWRGQVKITIPNPHDGDVGIGLLARILRQAGISREEWERL